jgi:glyoxylase-like metal-dependent hydrolase (beta-lactamase superfamily II)
MMSDVYSFQIGEFECFAVSDGTHPYENPAATFFTNAPEKQLTQVLQSHGINADQWQEYLSPFNCLAIKTKESCLLVDTGIGTDIEPGVGKLLDRLSDVGIFPDQIETVVSTHAHLDHIGGNTNSQGRYIISKAEWDYWTSETTLAADEFDAKMVRKNLIAIADRYQRIDQDTEIVPGICLLNAPGHQPGHIVVSIISGAERLLYTSDTFIHPLHIEHPEWLTVFEKDGEQAVSTRMRLLEKAAIEDDLVLAYHFPFPGLGHIHKKDACFEWVPIELVRPGK